MRIIKGMTEKEYLRHYYLEHYKPKTKINCEHGLPVSKCKICQSKKRIERYRKNYRPKPLTYDVCIICGKPFRKVANNMVCSNPQCIKTQRNNRDRAFRAEVRSHYGNRCDICGAVSSLEIDHVFGYGRQHREEVTNCPTTSNTFYQWLKRNDYPTEYTVNGITYKNGFRVLCKKCNNRQKRVPYRYRK